MRVVRARGPRRAEGCSRPSARRSQFARNLALRLAIRRHAGVWHLLRRTRFGLAVAMCALALAGAAASPSNGPEEAAFLAESEAAMNRMMAAMQIKPTNDVDRDFVAMMVPHHHGAIDMAEAELRYGRSEPLRGLAQEIIATQEQQIAVMRRAVGELRAPSLPSSRPSSQVRVAYSLIL